MSANINEIWCYHETPEPHLKRKGGIGTVLLSNSVGQQARDDLKRTAACHNACRGIEDPETTVPALIAGLKGAFAVIEARARSVEISGWQERLQVARDALSKVKETP